MKVKELVKELGLFVDYNKSDLRPDDNITFYYMQNDTLINSTFESFFDCNYEDVNGNVDYEFTIQNTMEVVNDEV
tara:strand:+ start:157 stop:381 length:225 start_codon:yes stop_codon:yes gene_type:complete